MAVDELPDGSVAKSPHVADDILIPFLQPTFDPADYLNATLPSLSITAPAREQPDRATVSDLSTRTASHLTLLSAQASRLSTVLTQLTDEIIRGGSRLAYEVEILRGETEGLAEAVQHRIAPDIAVFNSADADDGAEHISRLRTLTLVRARLDAVVRVFGDAMGWPLAPSELSSSLISVTAPDVGPEEMREREEKGREAARKLRAEVVELLEQGTTAEEGIAAAMAKLEDLRRLVGVWKGTAEERVRARTLDGLAKVVEDEQKKLAKKSEGRRQSSVPTQQSTDRRTVEATRQGTDASYGFINSLRKMRNDIYE